MPTSWLRDADNQRALLGMMLRIVASLSPLETPLVEGMVEDYVVATQVGEVITGVRTEEAFGFAGRSELQTLYLIPLVARILSHLLGETGVISVKQLQQPRSWERLSTTIMVLPNQIRSALPGIPAGQREKWAGTITSVIVTFLEEPQSASLFTQKVGGKDTKITQ